MKIKLNEIPTDGRDYSLSRKTAELNKDIQDLIAQNDYNVNVYIKPLNNKDFSVLGSLNTEKQEVCSRCGEDFNLKIAKKINEILIPSHEEDRTGKYAKSNVITENDGEETISVTEYSHQTFNLGEFVHENIALEIPFTPHCSNCLTKNTDLPFIYDEKMGDDTKPKPFEALKGLKLN